MKEQQAAISELTRTVLLDVQIAYQNWDQAKHSVEAFSSGRLSLAKELLEIMQSGYTKHANTYLELIDAQQLYRSENVEYIRALAAYNIAEATLLHASGGLVQ